jgi:hypothetical protein
MWKSLILDKTIREEFLCGCQDFGSLAVSGLGASRESDHCTWNDREEGINPYEGNRERSMRARKCHSFSFIALFHLRIYSMQSKVIVT